MAAPQLSLLDYAFMVSYLVGITVLGVWVARRKSNTDDFLLAGRGTGGWIAAFTLVMALLSTLSLVALPGEAYNNGLRLFLPNLIAPLSGLLMFSLFVRFYFMTKTFTPFSYLERRFDGRIRGIITVLYLFSRVSYLAIVLFSCSAIFKGAAGWPAWLTVSIMSVVCLLYCTMGGFRSVLVTNVAQILVMWGGLAAAVIATTLAVDGGVFGILSYAFEHGRGFEFSDDFFSFDPRVRVTFWVLLYSSLFSYMFYLSADQMALQPLLSTSSYVKARNSFIRSIFLSWPTSGVMFFLGLAMFAYFGQNPVEGGNPPGDIALFYFISNNMPTPLPGLVVSAMLAAAISTIASGLTGTAAVATKDVYLRFFRPQASEQSQVTFSRAATLTIGLFTAGVAFLIIFSSQALGETLIEASSVYIAITCIIPTTFFIGVMNPRCGVRHAVGAMLFGTVLTVGMVIWYMVSKFTGEPISFMLLQLPGGLGVILFGLTVPFIVGKKPQREKVEGLTLWTLKKEHVEIDLEKPLIEQVEEDEIPPDLRDG